MMSPDRHNVPPTSQNSPAKDNESPWLTKAREAFDASTSYLDTNYRKQWEDGIRAFNSQHPTDSKYTSPAYSKRSNIYRPKTRSVIRKNEAAAAAAFFSNVDQVEVKAEDESNKTQLASAAVMKALLSYRLEKSIDWFKFVMGSVQDSQVTGVCCAHVHWDFKYDIREQDVKTTKMVTPGDSEYPDQPQVPKNAFAIGSGKPAVEIEVTTKQKIITPKVDRPVCDLIPVENIRIDPSANWMDPINTSPYVIELMPMYVMDVMEKIDRGDWNNVSREIIMQATGVKTDTTRTARQKDRDDPAGTDTRGYDDINIVWVQRHIHRDGKGQEWDFYTLDTLALLSEPKKLEETVFHGRRPYVIGCFILEAHKAFPSGIPQLNRGLADEANEIANQRLDNVKFSLNKAWFAKRGKNVDVTGLVRNVPGRVVMMDDPINDVKEVSWPDVTGSAFEEQNRINVDMDELFGNFNPQAMMMMPGAQNAPARNMSMLSQSTGSLVEYGILTFVNTFVLPVLRQVMLLEQKYETDEVIMALAANKAQLFQKFGVDEVTDDLLNQELTLRASVGMGATDPQQKLQKFIAGITTYANILKQQVPGMDMKEVGKEVFGFMGYNDPTRFFSNDDPNVIALSQKLQQATAQIGQLQAKLQEKNTAQVIGLTKTRETNATKERIAIHQEANENKRSLATHITAIMQAASERKDEPKRKSA